VHGVEGFAGSAVQVAALKGIAAEAATDTTAAAAAAAAASASGNAASTRSKPYTLCFVHAVNPYGFAALRRFNENNVDLNRNNLTPEQWKQVSL
jgi:hypothetical protein